MSTKTLFRPATLDCQQMLIWHYGWYNRVQQCHFFSSLERKLKESIFPTESSFEIHKLWTKPTSYELKSHNYKFWFETKNICKDCELNGLMRKKLQTHAALCMTIRWKTMDKYQTIDLKMMIIYTILIQYMLSIAKKKTKYKKILKSFKSVRKVTPLMCSKYFPTI